MSTNITTIILAGGRGSRMGGIDKGMMVWKNKTLVEHVINRLRAQPGQLIISCNRHLDKYSALGARICTDKLAGFQGPLAGIQAALATSHSELNLVCACDTPYLPADLLSRLLEVLLRDNADICHPCDGQREQYLPVLIKSSVLASLDSYLLGGGRSIQGWYKGLRVSTADFSEYPQAFINFNDKNTLDLAT